MPSGSIEFEFKGNLAQLKRDLQQASRLAQQTARETGQATQKGFEGGIAGLFRRSPERRAELAFHGLAQDLASGDIAQALSNFSNRLSGLGLAAGIGVGVSIVAFQKFRESIEKANEVHKALTSELEKPIDIQLGLGPEGIEKQISAINAALEKSKDRTSVFIKDFLKHGPLHVEGLADLEKQRGELAINAARLASQRAKDELNTANLKLRSVTLSEKEAALEKISLDAEQKRNAIRLDRKGEPPINLQRAIEAVGIEEKAAREEVERKFNLKQREADMESYILSLKDKGLTKEQESNETIRARIQLLQSQLRGAQTEDRLPLQNKITALQQQLTPELPARVNVSGYTLPEILKSGLEPVIDNGAQNWRWPVDKNTLGATPVGLQMPSGPEGWDYNVNTGSWIMDKMGFKKTVTPESGSGMEGVGSGIDGIKKGIDDLNNKMDHYWGV